ncbi:MAG: asparaginase, partial [Alphaproteobacteria bacterium]|nr:asparaginase [Alphaproteobacteria bacterium]
MRHAEPIIVEVHRGPAIESRHLVNAVVTDTDGRMVAAFGDLARPVFPRSAAKPIQALPLIESGAGATLSDGELALACSSHSGEANHTATVAAWLKRLGLDHGVLECGSHLPYHEPTAHAMIRRGEAPCPLHNNCSGKHAGFVATAHHLNEAVTGYVKAGHPVQRRITAALADMSGEDLRAAPMAIDGCAIPTLAFPLAGLATAWARFGAPDKLTPIRAAACRRLFTAMTKAPNMVAGTGRACTAILEAGRGRVAVKTGAEGCYAACLPERGLGIALKCVDGAGRAAEVAVIALLRAFGGLEEAAIQ